MNISVNIALQNVCSAMIEGKYLVKHLVICIVKLVP